MKYYDIITMSLLIVFFLIINYSSSSIGLGATVISTCTNTLCASMTETGASPFTFQTESLWMNQKGNTTTRTTAALQISSLVSCSAPSSHSSLPECRRVEEAAHTPICLYYVQEPRHTHTQTLAYDYIKRQGWCIAGSTGFSSLLKSVVNTHYMHTRTPAHTHTETHKTRLFSVSCHFTSWSASTC